jgi:UDP-glucose 6-dehydrogenase
MLTGVFHIPVDNRLYSQSYSGKKEVQMENINTSPEYKVAIVGNGWVGKAYNKMFTDAVIYDEPQIEQSFETDQERKIAIEAGRIAVNECDLALICVPTNPVETEEGTELDMSIVESVVDWVDTPLILCKSALQPGTVDRLVEKTGKNIAVSVEMVGEGKYFVPYWKYPDAEDPTKHDFLIVGGEEDTAKRCADFIWRKMSPDIDIHLVSAVEAEITKLMENTWGAQKVTFANVMYDICEQYGANYTKVLQAWGADGRTEKMHMRVMPHKRGWVSKCYDKDVPALASIDESGFLKSMVEANEQHKDKNNS